MYQHYFLRLTGTLGVVVFAIFFTFTFTVPDWVERFAKEFIESEVRKKIDSSIDVVLPSNEKGTLNLLAKKYLGQNEDNIATLNASLKQEVHKRMADALADIRNLDCECRSKWATHFKKGLQFKMNFLQTTNDKIIDFIHASYYEVSMKLKRDIRIFTAINIAVFFTLLLISFAKRNAVKHLFLPAVLLLFSTILCSILYIFEQNWLLTIIYGNYWGFAYLSYLGLVFGFLCDIVFNRGRITRNILNSFLNAIGSISIGPC